MSGGPRLLACGDRAVLVELDDAAAVLAFHDVLAARRAQLAADPDADPIADVVPAARTVLVTARDGVALGRVRSLLAGLRPGDPSARPGERSERPPVRIEVRYDGADLDEVGRLTGLGAAGVVRAHTAGPWRVAFGGFAPGFAYLVGGDARLRVPRRGEARTAVPAGSVALAEEYSGVYPRPSPGGWQLIGTTAAELWSMRREPPALLAPGDRVVFVEVA